MPLGCRSLLLPIPSILSLAFFHLSFIFLHFTLSLPHFQPVPAQLPVFMYICCQPSASFTLPFALLCFYGLL